MSDNQKFDPTDRKGDSLSVTTMYQDYFLDYASYVILERAVPAIEDGLKPVQRRILHALKEMDDGRFHKVANVIGQTMQFHPHGDASIGDALVNIGQKNLLIETQGNWGDIRTGDSAAAPRYIEARLTKFALEVGFNPDITQWQLSYDGRKKEPIVLPMKFPLLLSEGVEGIAVGLSTKLMPHNFIEILEGCIAILKGKETMLLPDFLTGGLLDASLYNRGKRGGKIRVRAQIQAVDKKNLIITQIPYGCTTGSIIDSILKANDKGQIKIKKVVDNTAKDVEIAIELNPGISPDQTIDALYAFTECEISISPNACVIIDSKPYFLDVDEILKITTFRIKDLLGQELQIKLDDLLERWHFASLEKIFIENRVYHKIEECETWDDVINTIDVEMRKYILTPSMKAEAGDTRIQLVRELTEEDILRLTEIKIKRISKFNSFKADELIVDLNKEMEQVRFDLEHLNDYSIAYFKKLIDKYGKGRERKTTITVFDQIEAKQVVANNSKLYVNKVEGFMGYGIKKEEFISDCSDIDDIIAFRRDGKFIVSKIGEKVFVGKDIIHIAVWLKNDDRTTYHVLYVDGKSGFIYGKRFNVLGITRDKEYDLTMGHPNSKILYFSANPNGEAERVQFQLSPSCKAKIKIFDFDFATLAIKGRSSQGNIITKHPVKKITQKEIGKSTIGAQKIWFDDITGRLNKEMRGRFLGEFDTGDKILVIFNSGHYELTDFEMTNRYTMGDIYLLQKWDPMAPLNIVYFDGERQWTMVKRFVIDAVSLGTKYLFISEHPQSKLLFASTHDNARIAYTYKLKSNKMEGEITLNEFVDTKGWKALGNKLSDQLLTNIKEILPPNPEKVKVGDTIEFNLNEGTQGTLFDPEQF
ncbi:MAG: DNA gyrase/topoisomerase IV subunit A [Saprospiraceae bacterium]|jgi:topoisomerase-4 subunit A|nr:DNA gyrase/topoisomerase IV subunit A [Saprospiraceae bacterium]